jgi:hypothetical protein
MANRDGLPSRDGELTTYSSDPEFEWRGETLGRLLSRATQQYLELLPEPARRTAQSAAPTGANALSQATARSRQGQILVVYINGIQTEPTDHRGAAKLLATIIGRDVQGIYNITGASVPVLNQLIPNSRGLRSGLFDLRQCIMDVLLPVGQGRILNTPLNLVGAAFGSGSRDDEGARFNFAKAMLNTYNSAAAALLNRLFGNVRHGGRFLVVPHSQGNLIASNVLWLLEWIREGALGGAYCTGLASPAVTWPERGSPTQLHLELFRDPRDGVTLLSLPSLGQRPRQLESPGPQASGRLDLSFEVHDVARYMLLPRFQSRVRRWAAT